MKNVYNCQYKRIICLEITIFMRSRIKHLPKGLYTGFWEFINNCKLIFRPKRLRVPLQEAETKVMAVCRQKILRLSISYTNANRRQLTNV